MTRERREEVLLVALVLSLAIHVGLMVLVKPQVMTQIVPPSARAARHAPMRVARSVQRPDPVKIDDVTDLAAKKDAPAMRTAVVPVMTAPSAENYKATLPSADVPDPVLLAPDPKIEFDAKPVGDMTKRTDDIPMPIPANVETPAIAAVETVPEFVIDRPEVAAPRVADLPPSVDIAKEAVFLPSKMVAERAPKVDYAPAAEIYEKVDEQAVVEAKTAVRSLVETVDAADLTRGVNVSMASSLEGGWRYFKVTMTPRPTMKTVPKDMVLLIDGSGSIGNDRLGSCRKAARRILRTATNTGDRFNLVVFRNAFSYAFRNWRDCDAESFAVAENWLDRQTAHGRTDVFSTISSVLTLPRDPKRPLVALVVTDGDANAGVSNTSEILSKFTALNDGLVSVYMYGVKSSANRELIDVLTHGNRGESFVFDGWARWNAGSGIDGLSERFRDPVLSDIRVVFASGTQAETYPRLLRNLYRGGTLEFVGRVPADAKEVAFSLKGLNGDNAYEGFFKLPFAAASADSSIASAWRNELAIDRKLNAR